MLSNNKMPKSFQKNHTIWIGAALTACMLALMTGSILRAQQPADKSVNVTKSPQPMNQADEFGNMYKRFEYITPDMFTPAQKKYVEMRGGYPTDPFEHIMLRNPGEGETLSVWLNHFRVNGSLTTKQEELGILFAGRFWNSQVVWMGHAEAARKAGASQAAMDSIEQGKRLPGMAADELALYNLLDEIYTKHAVSDATFKAAVDQLGEPGILDLMGVTGFYDYLSKWINVVEVWPPENGKAKLPKYPQAK